MWLLILHVFTNVLGLVLLMAGSFQILVGKGRTPSPTRSESKAAIKSPSEAGSEKSKNIRPRKNKLIEGGWYLYTLGVILGAFQAKETIGAYWTWDLKEILSLLTLVGYLIYITMELKMNAVVKRFLIAGCLLLAILTLLVPTFALSYHNPFSLFASAV